MAATIPDFAVALSFAGEDRSYVDQVARSLEAKGVSVFYDRSQEDLLWGRDLAETFHEVYSAKAGKVAMFVSKAYVDKAWPRHERRSAISAAITKGDPYILMVRFDDTPVPGIPSTLGWQDARVITPEQLALRICRQIGINPLTIKADAVAAPRHSEPSGRLTFRYSSFNGRVVIGDAEWQFEVKWSKASNRSIYILNDPPSIRGVAIAERAKNIHEVSDASALDYTSRSRCPQTGQVAMLQNVNGFYVALKIEKITDDTRNEPADDVTFSYRILTDGSADFSKG